MSDKTSMFETKKWKLFMAKLYGFGAAVVIVGALFKIQHWPGAGPMLILGLGTEAVIFAFSAFEPIHEELDWALVYPELGGMTEEQKNMELGEGGEDLSLTQQLDNMLEEAKIGPELLESLGAGMRGLSESVTKIGDIADASVASKEFTDNISKATTSVDQLSQTYQRASDSVSSSVDQLAGAYSRASKTLETLAIANDDSITYSEQLGKVSKNLSALNAAYELQLQGSNDHLKATNSLYEGINTVLTNLNESVDDTRKYRTEINSLATNLEALNTVYGNMLTAMNVRK
ncbi:MAG: gliding motility protein GldL [Bacteroidetes bacterium]|nr:gliding motility protein GldL [Bacteroidota bacterium]PHX82410.1 MAG: gliding motility protein GldL [Flavobacteriales bacterium]